MISSAAESLVGANAQQTDVPPHHHRVAGAPQVEHGVVAVDGETMTCPSCFARVPQGIRCSDCGMPFPLQEL